MKQTVITINYLEDGSSNVDITTTDSMPACIAVGMLRKQVQAFMRAMKKAVVPRLEQGQEAQAAFMALTLGEVFPHLKDVRSKV